MNARLRELLVAATRPTSLLVLGGSVAAGLALHITALPALGALAYAALFTWEAVSAGDRPKARTTFALPDPGTMRDPSVRYAVTHLQRARTELDQVLADTPADIVGGVREALVRIDELWTHSGTLIEQAERLYTYLSTQPRAEVEAEIKRLGERIADTRDPQAQAEYERARATRAGQLETLSRIEGARDRALAHLAGIQAVVEGLGPKVVHMRALDAEEQRTISLDVSRELERTNDDVRAFESSLQGLLELSRR